MVPNDKNTAAGNPTSRGQANKDQNTTSANAQDHTLLKALQDLIVRVVDSKQTININVNQIQSGPEAAKLITALQEFVSKIVGLSQFRTQNTVIEVSLEEANELQGSDGVNENRQGSTLPRISPAERDEEAVGDINSGGLVSLEKPRQTFEEKLLRALRKHVFNEMPIRLLCFEPMGSRFRISLSDRGAIYERLISVLKGKMQEEELRPKTISFDIMETDREAIERTTSKYTAYAILSHTWLRTSSGEVTYGDWNRGLFSSEDLGYQKLVNFCKVAWKDHGLAFGWMDTVCINKQSSSELDESIRSMYSWYERAAVCITYLAETETITDMHLDPWFTRGWTLQELLAPRILKFYDSRWKCLVEHSFNDKQDTEITQRIERATTISLSELRNIRMSPISRRMQMAATREVTREEDTAYSLMGIFSVSISIAYGEGAKRAFLRLLQEIMASFQNTLDILNWAGNIPLDPFSSLDNTSAILPTSPKCYMKCSSNRNLILGRPIEPLTLSHLGLHVPVILMPGMSIQQTELRHDPIGDYEGTAIISPVSLGYGDSIPTAYNLLDNRVCGKDGWKDNRLRHYQMTLAVFNFKETRNLTSLPKTCIALGLECNKPVGEVSKSEHFDIVRTEEPIVFGLSKSPWKANSGDSDDLDYWKIQTDKLAKHGMQLISLYL